MHAHQSKNIPSADRQVAVRQFLCVFFLLWELKVCVDLCKKSDRTRCLAVSILEYNINLYRPFWFSEGRTK